MKNNFSIRADRMRLLMEENNMGLDEFTEGVELSRGTAKQIVDGKLKMPRLVTLNKICDCLNCSADYLIGRSDNPYPVG